MKEIALQIFLPIEVVVNMQLRYMYIKKYVHRRYYR
jgi:hypothetical protein